MENKRTLIGGAIILSLLTGGIGYSLAWQFGPRTRGDRPIVVTGGSSFALFDKDTYTPQGKNQWKRNGADLMEVSIIDDSTGTLLKHEVIKPSDKGTLTISFKSGSDTAQLVIDYDGNKKVDIRLTDQKDKFKNSGEGCGNRLKSADMEIGIVKIEKNSTNIYNKDLTGTKITIEVVTNN